VTYRLRTDVHWHDGRPVTAHDVAFTMRLLAHPDVMYFPPSEADGVTVIDDSTFTTRSHPYPTDIWIVYYPKHLLEGQDLNTQLKEVNRAFNAHRYILDIKNWGEEDYWATPFQFLKKNGDCEDYALEKRQALLEAGIPGSALFLAVGHSRATGRHAVLVVSTDSGDYVLDNMTPHIVPWSQAPYIWLIRQMPGDLLAWRHTGATSAERRAWFPRSLRTVGGQMPGIIALI
jgi:predicted transglutaminase-like cysteine proteinase